MFLPRCISGNSERGKYTAAFRLPSVYLTQVDTSYFKLIGPNSEQHIHTYSQ
jgi:hypothetical protein